MLFGAASRPRPGGASIRQEDEKRRLKTTDVASIRSPEIPPVREYGPRRFRENAEMLGEIETIDTGKLYRETKKQAVYIAEYYDYYAGLADKVKVQFCQ